MSNKSASLACQSKGELKLGNKDVI